jgi:hypothetical protein
MSGTTTDASEAKAYYHVVCRDCLTESVQTDAETAERVRSRHESETGHVVAVGSI